MTNTKTVEIKTIKTAAKTLIKLMEKYDNVTFFVHEKPDPDALGSAYGLSLYLQRAYKKENKSFRIAGIDELNAYTSDLVFSEYQQVAPDDDYIKSSFGIIMDTADEKRIFTGKHVLCKETFRIDHHPLVEYNSDYQYVDASHAATCEIITLMIEELLIHHAFTRMNRDAANCLYTGLVTDTGRFLFDNVSVKTYHAAQILTKAKINKTYLHDYLYSDSFEQIRFNAKLVDNTKIRDGILAYSVIDKKVSEEHPDCRIEPNLMRNIKGVEIWSTLYYDFERQTWKGSLRSRNMPINQIAAKYGGGGHNMAAGFKIATKAEYDQVLDDVIEAFKEYQSYEKELVDAKHIGVQPTKELKF